jgi:hypothetical protein
VTAALSQALDPPVGVPVALSERIQHSLAEAPIQGATRLRSEPARSGRRAVWSAAAVVVATLAAVVFVVPMVKGPASVSAAEILARSADRLAERATGVEVLEYELTLDGMPREMMPDYPEGVARVTQVIDHDTPGRYLVASYDSRGQLRSSVAQDPTARRRVMSVVVEDQAYRFEFTVPEGMALSPPEIERLHLQASVAMMQASGDQNLQVIDTGAGRQYRIDVPRVSAQTTNAVWDLLEAQVVIDATDHHIVEFAAEGTFLRQPYSVSYRLISRTIAAEADLPADAFEVPRDATAITIVGEGTAIPVRDALVVALREIARARRAQ